MDDFDFDDFDDSRPNGGCGLVFVGLFLLLLLMGWVLTHLHQLKVASATVIGVASLALLAREAYRRFPRGGGKRKAGGMPTPLANVQPGVVSTAGLVGFRDQPLHAPLGTPPCVFYRAMVSLLSDPEKIIFEGRSTDVLTLEDLAGAKLAVRLDGASFRTSRYQERESNLIEADEDVARFLSERGVVASGPVRVRIEWIAPHELVFVRGLVRRIGEDAPASYRTSERTDMLEMAGTAEHPVLIALEPIS